MWRNGALSAPAAATTPALGPTSPEAPYRCSLRWKFLDAGPPQSWLRETGSSSGWGGHALSRWQPRALQSGRAWKWSQVRAPGFTPPRNSPRLQAELSPVPDPPAGGSAGLIWRAEAAPDGGGTAGGRPAQWEATPPPSLNPRFHQGPLVACTRHRRDSASAPGTSGRETGRGPRARRRVSS